MKNVVLFVEPRGVTMEVIRVAKLRGYEVIALVADETLLDSLPQPYCQHRSHIDQVVKVLDWNNQNHLRAVVESLRNQYQVEGLYFALDPCAVAGTFLRNLLNLPSPKTQVMEEVLNKRKLRKKLLESGLSKLNSISEVEAELWDNWKFQGAAYFKPVHGAFSLFVKRCDNFEDFQKARTEWRSAIESSLPNYMAKYLFSEKEYHLEEALDGELLSVEAISYQGKFQSIGLTSRILFSQNPNVEMGSCFPYPHPQHSKIVEKVQSAHEALGFTDGPTHTEVIVGKNGEIEIIDFNPRFVGADVLQSINNAYGIHIEEALLDWALGKVPNLDFNQQGFSCLQYVLPPEAFVFRGIAFPSAPEVRFSTHFPKLGTEVHSLDRQLDYLGCYLTVMPTFAEALERSHQLRPSVKINDILQGAY